MVCGSPVMETTPPMSLGARRVLREGKERRRRLHYGTLLGSRACGHMAAAAWATGFLYSLLNTANTFSLPLCKGNALDQFFCEIPQILKLSCSDTYLREIGLIVFSVCLISVCFILIMLSYVQIFRAVLRIPSEQGRHKAFSTCLPHLAVVSLFVSTAIFAHLKPPSISSLSLDLVVSVLYSLVPPAGSRDHFPGEPVPVTDHPPVKNFLLMSSLNIP
ncbi:olfactory receptor 14J1-like [Caloenas nicobarica]|uniref:olfactory receptor 14J1-like n=1 Tax=Caloenas nicobarica TaxID=187106 RepID=UPI0032B71189